MYVYTRIHRVVIQFRRPASGECDSGMFTPGLPTYVVVVVVVEVVVVAGCGVRPVSPLRCSLLRFVDSRFQGKSLWT